MDCKWFNEYDQHGGFKKFKGNITYPMDDR